MVFSQANAKVFGVPILAIAALTVFLFVWMMSGNGGNGGYSDTARFENTVEWIHRDASGVVLSTEIFHNAVTTDYLEAAADGLGTGTSPVYDNIQLCTNSNGGTVTAGVEDGACTGVDLNGGTANWGTNPASNTATDAGVDGIYAVTVHVKEDGGQGPEATAVFMVDVMNVAPDYTPPENQSSDEGSEKSFSVGSFVDPGPSHQYLHIQVLVLQANNVV